MALTSEQEKGLLAILAAFQNGKRINDLAEAKGALKDMRIEVMDETGETHRMELATAVEQPANPIAGRYWNTANSTPTAAGYYGSLQALRELPAKLGLGRYLVTDDRKKRKLDPTDSTKYADGSPAALDGTQGQCMWCWNSFIANIFTEGGTLVKAITFDKPVGNGVSVRIPAGGTSWLGAGVMDRTNTKLCSVISEAEQFRGGAGSALNKASYAKSPAAEAAQVSMLGMPATQISTTNFGTYARKRGEGWEANWFVAQFVAEFLIEIIMGTTNTQAAFVAEKDTNGLYQGGFGTGVTDMPDWGGYNGYYSVIPTKVGLEAGDGVCLVPYNLPASDGSTYKTFNVPVFFGLVHANYGNLWRWVRGMIINAGDKSEVNVLFHNLTHLIVKLFLILSLFSYIWPRFQKEYAAKINKIFRLCKKNKQEKSLIKQNISLYLAKKGVSDYVYYKESGTTRGILGQNNGISEENISRFLAYAPDVNHEWLLTGKGNMLKKEEETEDVSAPVVSYDPKVGQPYYDVDFLGGFSEIYNSQVSLPDHNIIVPGFDRAHLWCNVTGHSMEPQISHGDIIALRPCTIDDIQYGEMYAVVLDTIRTIKIIRRGSSKKFLRYVPINPNFDEQEFEVNRIINVFEVIGSISKFF